MTIFTVPHRLQGKNHPIFIEHYYTFIFQLCQYYEHYICNISNKLSELHNTSVMQNMTKRQRLKGTSFRRCRA